VTDGPVVLTAPVLRAWVAGALGRLETHRADLDALNVFPVADSDTGTNLSLTLAEAAAAIDALPADASAARVGVALARGALVGARGNSGVIVSQYLGALLRHGGARPDGPAGALEAAAHAAYAAVAQPVEGTVLTIGREVALGARTAADAGVVDVTGLIAAGLAAGYAGLERTPQMLATLHRAGVVDAGALGLLLVLDALLVALGGATHDRATAVLAAGADRRAGSPVPRGGDPGAATPDACGEGGEFEVMYLVTGRGTAAGTGAGAGDAHEAGVGAELSAALSVWGQSVAVVGGEGLWQAHVHTDRPLDVLALQPPATTRCGQFRIRHLATQAGVHGLHRRALGLVAVTGAVGLVPDLARAGAVVVLVPPGDVVGPELGRAVDDTGAGYVLVLAVGDLPPTALPDGAGALARTGRAGVDVVAGLTEAQLVAGAATFTSLDPALGDAVLLGLVWDAVSRVRSVVVPGPLTGDGGDVGGQGQGGAVLAAALDLLTGASGLLTVLTGARTAPGPVQVLVTGLASARPEVDVVVLDGVLPGDGLVLGAE